jgi:sodium pump decarboxylase gamma subunit
MYFPLLSIGEVLKLALLNTLLGMGIVFGVLIFISLLISLFVYIPKIQDAFQKNKTTKNPIKKPYTAPETTVSEVVKEPMDDLELIAVITAAIAASTGVPQDSFVVRSIRRSPANHWNQSI